MFMKCEKMWIKDLIVFLPRFNFIPSYMFSSKIQILHALTYDNCFMKYRMAHLHSPSKCLSLVSFLPVHSVDMQLEHISAAVFLQAYRAGYGLVKTRFPHRAMGFLVSSTIGNIPETLITVLALVYLAARMYSFELVLNIFRARKLRSTNPIQVYCITWPCIWKVWCDPLRKDPVKSMVGYSQHDDYRRNQKRLYCNIPNARKCFVT